MGNTPTNYTLLLEGYQSLWNNRNLIQGADNSEDVLRTTVLKDLLDEMTHPRVRKNSFEKFYLASKRINESTLSIEDKISLQKIYIEEMDNLNRL